MKNGTVKDLMAILATLDENLVLHFGGNDYEGMLLEAGHYDDKGWFVDECTLLDEADI